MGGGLAENHEVKHKERGQAEEDQHRGNRKGLGFDPVGVGVDGTPVATALKQTTKRKKKTIRL